MSWKNEFFALLSPETAKRVARELGGKAGRTDNPEHHATFDGMPTQELRDEWNRGYCDNRWNYLS